jgi:hypothetical protein
MIILQTLWAAPPVDNSVLHFMFILIYGYKSDLTGEEILIGSNFYPLLSESKQPPACTRPSTAFHIH